MLHSGWTRAPFSWVRRQAPGEESRAVGRHVAGRLGVCWSASQHLLGNPVPWNQAGGGEVGSGLGPGVAPVEPFGKPSQPQRPLWGAGSKCLVLRLETKRFRGGGVSHVPRQRLSLDHGGNEAMALRRSRGRKSPAEEVLLSPISGEETGAQSGGSPKVTRPASLGTRI